MFFCFNPRAPAGRDEKAVVFGISKTCFNPRAPAGRDGLAISSEPRHSRFQSTRPCGARPAAWQCRSTQSCVSIHAPLRGATSLDSLFESERMCFNPRAPAGRDVSGLKEAYTACVSIHAPLRGATYRTCVVGKGKKRFQSTRPCGARLELPLHPGPNACVSIHAPLRGATSILRPNDEFGLSFNPRAPAGRDKRCRSSGNSYASFNPRAPAGRDALILQR